MHFWVTNYRDAQQHLPTEPTLTIRIFDPNTRPNHPDDNHSGHPLQVSPLWIDELHYTFADYDATMYELDGSKSPENFQYFANHPQSLDTRQAAKLVTDFQKRLPSVQSVLVHCNAGMSRSPAVALALCHRFGIVPEWKGRRAHFMKNMVEDFKTYGRAANMWVYWRIMDAD